MRILLLSIHKFFLKRISSSLIILQTFTINAEIKEEKEIHEKKLRKIIPKYFFYYYLVEMIKQKFQKEKGFFIKKFISKHKIINKSVDYYIMANFAEVNLNVDKEINKKEKLNMMLDVFNKIMKYKSKSSFLQTLSMRFTFFNRWKQFIIMEKHQILEEIKTLQTQNVFKNLISRKN